jgi:hypothetical protein
MTADELLPFMKEELGDYQQTRVLTNFEIDEYRGKLPNLLLDVWQQYGLLSFSGHLFRFVYPKQLEGLVATWIQDTPLPDIDTFHAFALTAFGDIFMWGQNNGKIVRITPTLATINARECTQKTPEEDRDLKIEASLIMFQAKYADYRDTNGELLFKRATKKLGPLKENEIFGFVPALALGGLPSIDRIEKVDYESHLVFLSQLDEVTFPFGL